MKVLVATDFRVSVYNNEYYVTGKLSTILERYSKAFGRLILFSRVKKCNELDQSYYNVSNIVDKVIGADNLAKIAIGYYDKAIAKEICNCNLVISRLPSFAGYRAADMAKKNKVPYMVENMGCAWDGYWNHGIIGKIIAPYMFGKMKQVVKNADYAVYVTEKFLQKRYPCPNPSIAASNVFIQKTDKSVLQKRFEHIANMNVNNIMIMTTAAVYVRYKGQQYVIEAIPKLNAAGIRVKYVLLGEGDPSYLQEVAKKCGVEEQVSFAGRTSLDGVFRLLDEADLYIQPSLQEGLPRSVIEAMSRGCPCIGARTGGIPELLEDRFVFACKSANEIAEKILEFSRLDSVSKGRIAERNLSEADLYSTEILDKKRNDFFELILNSIKKEEI